MSEIKHRLDFPREVLLVEIERRCADALCHAKARIGLTKEEARVYNGFACERCERWNDDMLAERDIPEWWEELMITGLDTVRAKPAANAAHRGEPDDVISRMSDAWRRAGLPEGDEVNTEEDSF